ncbi:hypothetical protein B566_EDAN008477, partial [Ephemera danica]
ATTASSVGRRRFVLRRSSSTELPRARKRHLQADPHFQPVQEGVPRENLMSFLEFGQKLPTSPNSISEQKPSVTPGYSQKTSVTPSFTTTEKKKSVSQEYSTESSVTPKIFEKESVTPVYSISEQKSFVSSDTLESSSVASESSIVEDISDTPNLSSTEAELLVTVEKERIPLVTPGYSRVIINVENVTRTTDNPISTTTTTTSTTTTMTPIITQSSTSELVTSSSTLVRAITVSTPPASLSQSDDAFNDIMANSQRRRRKKLIARRLQLNNATEILVDHVMNETVMNAAIVRRKSLLQPQRNISQPQNVLRRPLTRITSVPSVKNVTDSSITTQTSETYIRHYTNIDRSNRTEESANTTPRIIINSSNEIPQNITTRRVEVTVRTSTTSTPNIIIRNNSVNNNTFFVPITRVHSNVSTKYNVETTTRRAWRPISTMRPLTYTERSTTTEKLTTTEKPTTTTTTTQRVVVTLKPNKVTEGRTSPSETTFISGDTQPSAEFTERPLLGAPRDVVDDGGPGISLVTYVLVSLALVTAVGVASYGARHLAKRRRRMLDESELSSSESSSVAGATLKRGAPHGSSDDLGRLAHGWGDKSALQTPPPPLPPHPQWHFPRDQLRLQTVLGQGNFGQVWKAEAEDICGLPGTRLVAVKSTKSGAGERERSDLLRELAIMQQLGAHPNVVTLLGCCTEQEPHLLIMEYVMYGKLLTFLRDHRTRRDCLHFSSSDDGGEQALTSRDLTHFAYCVAKGMDYLVSRGGALPIRWMAPESLVRSVFTHPSDVWSFGILMWEIVTLGSTPYPTMGAREVMRRVREGYRLERPPHCRPELFRVVASCWMADPVRRPDFAELRAELRRLRDEGAACPGGGHVDLESALPPPSPGPNTAPPTAGPAPSDPGGM